MPTIEEFYAPELRFEPEAYAILKAAGLKVIADYLNQSAPEGTDPNLVAIPDEACEVSFEMGAVDESIRIFRTDETLEGGLASEPAGFEGVLTITHRIPVSDLTTSPGDLARAYERLCRQRGLVRSLFRSTAQPFRNITEYDITNILLLQPTRGVDEKRSANEAKERFQIKWMPTPDNYPSG